MRIASLLVLALLVPTLAACSVRFGGSKSVDKTLADLRTENKQLKSQLADAQGQLQELAARTNAGETSPFSVGEIALATPEVVSVAFASSAGIDKRDPTNPKLVLDVVTLDGRSRFTQAVGQLRVTASTQDRQLADITLSPTQLREAYRSSVLGTRYALEVALPPEVLAAKQPITLNAQLLDAAGRTLITERVLTTGE
jgi:hypothetical protein